MIIRVSTGGLIYEMAGCLAMLDVMHDSLLQSLDDWDEYTFRRIGSHSVVIASLFPHHNDTSSVPQVASQMPLTCPALRFGLRVSIGSGVSITVTKRQSGIAVVRLLDRESGGCAQDDIEKKEDQRAVLLAPIPLMHHIKYYLCPLQIQIEALNEH